LLVADVHTDPRQVSSFDFPEVKQALRSSKAVWARDLALKASEITLEFIIFNFFRRYGLPNT